MGLRSAVARRWPNLAPIVGKSLDNEALLPAHVRPEQVRFDLDGRAQTAHPTWYRGENCNFIPDREALSQPDGIDRWVMHGWQPEQPFITKSDPITTFGSCFAIHIVNYLDELGYNVPDRSKDIRSYVIRCGEGMVNTAAIAQQLQWAYGEIEFNEPLWYDKRGREASYNDVVRAETRKIFDKTNAFIVTLGLSEVWYNKETGDVFWRAIPRQQFDPEKHGFKVLNVQENRDNLNVAIDTIRRWRPDAAIIFTLSPVPLVATFRPVSCFTANSVSKASLRMAVDEIMRERPEDGKLFYFPSYEIVKEVMLDPYEDDLRHIRPDVVQAIMKTFDRHYLVR